MTDYMLTVYGNQGHRDVPHRAETGEPPRPSEDGKHTVLPMAVWDTNPENRSQ